jgi:hypothetical protein
MKEEVRPLPPGDAGEHPPGTEEVMVLRHADPVRIRPAGAVNARPLSFYEKQARLTAGAQVIVAAGGRGEVLFPDGGSIVFFGYAVAWIGSPSRGEPICDLREVERARVMLSEADQLRLVGGAVLSGAGGPYLLSTDDDARTLAVDNQSKGPLSVAFREELFELGPGQEVRLPLLSAGGAPFQIAEGLRRIGGPGFNVDVLGPLEAVPSERGLAVRGSGEAIGLGVRVRLEGGAEATFQGLGDGTQGEAPAVPYRTGAPEGAPPGEAPEEEAAAESDPAESAETGEPPA